MPAVPITSPAQAGRLEPAATGVFQRAAGIFALLTGAVILPVEFAGGSQPSLGASPAKVAAYFAAHTAVHKAWVILVVAAALPVALYMTAVYQTLSRAGDTPWRTMFLYGAVMMSATAGMNETIYGVLALRVWDTKVGMLDRACMRR